MMLHTKIQDTMTEVRIADKPNAGWAKFPIFVMLAPVATKYTKRQRQLRQSTLLQK